MSDLGAKVSPMPNRLERLLGMVNGPSAEDYAAAIDAAELTAARAPASIGLQAPSVFHPDSTSLQAVVWADLTNTAGVILTRADAIAIPALARQRHLLCGTIADCPLRVIDGPTNTEVAQVPGAPSWTSRTDGTTSPYHRMLWTIDDLMFHGWSLWSAQRGYANGGALGPLLAADRIPPDRWELDGAGRVLVDDQLAKADEVIAIPGPHEGILNFGARALRRTIANLDAAANAARNPSAYLELHYTGDTDLTPEQIQTHIARWAAARRGENGGVAWTNKVLELREHGTHEAHLLIEGRNADAVDVSRLVSSPASMADATNAGASLTYETSQGRNGEFVDYGVGLYMGAVRARLSMDDVVPRGQRVGFDTSELRAVAPAPTGVKTDD